MSLPVPSSAHSPFLSFHSRLSRFGSLASTALAQSPTSTVTKIASEKFQMTEKQGRATEISRRETEIMRAELIADEMASAVRLLGGTGTAKEQNWRAARATGLTQTIIERLRWKKIKRIPADIADTVREAVHQHNEGSLTRAKHELFIAQQKNAVLAAKLRAIDPDLYRAEIDRLGRPLSGLGRDADFPSRKDAT
jgi:hypothetical protein|uniref:Uncharacterized protein n=2 Tax=Phyllobacteriaceae TaxID=69277 RepID=Q11J32_CHESB